MQIKIWWLAAWALGMAMTASAHGPAEGQGAHDHTHPTQAAHPAPPVGVKLDAHTREDIERHHSMARAHTQAAQCLAQGNSAKHCQEVLQTACKGLALGKSCGLRHAH